MPSAGRRQQHIPPMGKGIELTAHELITARDVMNAHVESMAAVRTPDGEIGHGRLFG